MKKKPASNYDRQMILENAIGILFSLALTIFFVLNKEAIIEAAKSIAFLH